MLLGYILKNPQDKDAIYECIATGLTVILVSWPLLALVKNDILYWMGSNGSNYICHYVIKSVS